MSSKISQKALEVKYSGSAIECGSLDILLEALHMQDVLLIPLERTTQNGPQVLKQVLLHVTARPHAQAPVYYASFLVVEILGLARTAGITFPYRGGATSAEEVLAQAKALTQQAEEVLKVRLAASRGRVSRVVMPARYRLPDEWVWSNRCQGLVYREGVWQFVGRGEEVSNG